MKNLGSRRGPHSENTKDLARCVDVWHVCRHCIAGYPMEVVALYITVLCYNGLIFAPNLSQVACCHTDTTTVVITVHAYVPLIKQKKIFVRVQS